MTNGIIWTIGILMIIFGVMGIIFSIMGFSIGTEDSFKNNLTFIIVLLFSVGIIVIGNKLIKK